MRISLQLKNHGDHSIPPMGEHKFVKYGYSNFEI